MTVHSDHRSISGDFRGAKFGDNVNLQGDYATQSKTIRVCPADDLIKSLIEQINKIEDKNERQDALDNAKKLQQALVENDIPRAKKIFGWLPQFIQTCAAGVQLAATFGLIK